MGHHSFGEKELEVGPLQLQRKFKTGQEYIRSCVKAKPKAWGSFSALDRDTVCPRSHGKKNFKSGGVCRSKGAHGSEVVRTLGEQMR